MTKNKFSTVFYDDAMNSSNDKKRKISLQRIKQACDTLENTSKEKTYSIADIGKYCELTWGGPKAQSIRNSSSVLEKYVKLRAAEFSETLTTSHVSASGGKKLNLANPAIAQQQYMLALAELDQLNKEIKRLKVDINLYTPTTTDELLKAARNGGPTSLDITALGHLPINVLNAIRSLFDVDNLRKCELAIDKNGYLINEINGNELLSSNEVYSLKSLL